MPPSFFLDQPSPCRPVHSATIDKAKAIAFRYTLILQPTCDGGFAGSSREMPAVLASGKTADVCVAALREGLTEAVIWSLERGMNPVQPMAPG